MLEIHTSITERAFTVGFFVNALCYGVFNEFGKIIFIKPKYRQCNG